MIFKQRRPYILLCLIALAGTLTGCATPKGGDTKYLATRPIEVAPVKNNTGSIYQAGTSLALFEDIKAKRVGDILTIVLDERTNAEKTADTTVDKSSETGIGVPKLFGQVVPEMENSLSAGHKFETEGDSKQSNKLEGSITVTVARVLSNGNLVVQGEKWITINHGEEFIRIRGVVRPMDIGSDNSVSSTKVADAQILYSGKGTLARANKPGWLTEFFLSPLMPF
ncbi:flagellar basal body L-ring protein FlgH [Thiolapillus brandeum]|uniref:Flagellar L-ring protein n=1 Tax=Thiolapillus brandeum TaxID=1076588 RepID=A0A7U6GII4_9GAMM|nr:flagellar basal body L-ring protein FlgH [Thiolapillus brandeum]BAO44291.1 flagellar L-ring protein precursor FlgH [Thiolapillus brandeum]